MNPHLLLQVVDDDGEEQWLTPERRIKAMHPTSVQGNLTTISTEPKILWEFGLQKLKTCSLYHEKLFIQVVNDISSQVFNNFFSASDFMEAVRGRLCFYRYECNARLRDTS